MATLCRSPKAYIGQISVNENKTILLRASQTGANDWHMVLTYVLRVSVLQVTNGHIVEKYIILHHQKPETSAIKIILYLHYHDEPI